MELLNNIVGDITLEIYRENCAVVCGYCCESGVVGRSGTVRRRNLQGEIAYTAPHHIH